VASEHPAPKQINLSYCNLPMECDEVADNFPLPTRRLTFDEALAIVRQTMPDESEAVLSNVAERLRDRSHTEYPSNESYDIHELRVVSQ
jgi:hypothetical protein